MTDIVKGFLSQGRTPEDMIVLDYRRLAEISDACKKLGLTVGLTQGSYDIKHVGHDRYLAMAKKFCDVLFVGVDSDEKIRKSKGPNRPVVNEQERVEQLCHLRSVNIVTLKQIEYPHLALQKAVRPDVLIVSRATKRDSLKVTQDTADYSSEELMELQEHCGRVEILDPQAETTTTARIRTLMFEFQSYLTDTFIAQVPDLVKQIVDNFFQREKK